MQTLSQQRAEFALRKVVEAETERFKPFSAGAASIILQNGFGQAMAFWYSKGQKEHGIMTGLIEEWLRKRYPGEFGNRVEMNPQGFLSVIMKLDQSVYHSMQQETIMLLEWVKRFANAFIKGGN
ncbi:MAG TPA: type III-B CRISPR module-associated protein Cmr5 [Sediminispirochaeta sp.]|nr:type III-B CRISPR module-associated protein Cmr5 [Sediminispirochaeta sp.]